MKRRLILALAGAGVMAVAGAPVAEAHVLPAKTAQKAANKYGKKIGQEYIDENPNRASGAAYQVDPCSRKTDHRFACRLHVYGTDTATGQEYDCHATIVVQASKSNFAYSTKLTNRKAC